MTPMRRAEAPNAVADRRRRRRPACSVSAPRRRAWPPAATRDTTRQSRSPAAIRTAPPNTASACATSMAGAGDVGIAVAVAGDGEHQVADELAGREQADEHTHVGGAGDGRGQPADRRGEHGQQHRPPCRTVRRRLRRRGQPPPAPRSAAPRRCPAAGRRRSPARRSRPGQATPRRAIRSASMPSSCWLIDVVGSFADWPSACSRRR